MRKCHGLNWILKFFWGSLSSCVKWRGYLYPFSQGRADWNLCLFVCICLAVYLEPAYLSKWWLLSHARSSEKHTVSYNRRHCLDHGFRNQTLPLTRGVTLGNVLTSLNLDLLICKIGARFIQGPSCLGRGETEPWAFFWFVFQEILRLPHIFSFLPELPNLWNNLAKDINGWQWINM